MKEVGPDRAALDPLLLGIGQVMRGPELPGAFKAMNLRQDEIAKTGLGHLVQALHLLTAAVRTDDCMADKLKELQHAVEAEKIISSQAARKIADQQAKLVDLKSQLSRCEAYSTELEESNKKLGESTAQTALQHQHDLKVAFRYGLVKALEAEPGTYNLAAEQANLQNLKAGPEEAEEEHIADVVQPLINPEGTPAAVQPEQLKKEKKEEVAESSKMVEDKLT